MVKALYSHRHGKIKHINKKHHVFPVREVGNPIVLLKVPVRWDFPTSVTLKSLPSRET